MAREDDAPTPDPTGGGSTDAAGPGMPPPFVPGQRGVHHPRDPRTRGGLGSEPPTTEPAQPRPADTPAADPFAAFPHPAPPTDDSRTAPAPAAGGADTPTPSPTARSAPGRDDTVGAPAHEGPPDTELADRVRAGDGNAYAPLYERHSPSVRRYARTCTRTPEAAEDLCAEAFARTLQALRAGHGPREAVRAYLLTTVRHVAGDWARSDRKERLTEDFTVFEAACESQDHVVKADDARLAMLAFQDLSARSRVVLWHVDIEGEQAVQVAPLLGENPANVRKILERARQELRDNYFVAFATGGVQDENCKKFTRLYGRHIRNRMDSAKRRESVDAHLRSCSRCNDTYAEMVDVRDRYGPIAIAMIGITAPAFLGGTAAAADAAAAGTVAAAGVGLATGGGAVAGGVVAGAGIATAANAGRAGRGATRVTLAAGGVVVLIAAVAFALVGNDRHSPRPQVPPAAVSAPASPLASPPPAPTPSPLPSRPAAPAPAHPPASTDAAPHPTPDATTPRTAARPPLKTPPTSPRPARPIRHAAPKPSPTRPQATPKPRPRPGPTLNVDEKGFHADDHGITLDCANAAGQWCANPTITVPEEAAEALLPPGTATACVPVKGVHGTAYTLCPR